MVSCDTSNSAESKDDKSEIIQLNHIQNNFFESNNEVHWTVYVKEVDSSTCSIQFTTNTVLLKFKTNDEKFFETNKVTLNKNAFFEWNATLNGNIIADKCKYNVTKIKIEIKLIKQTNAKWSNVVLKSAANEETTQTNTQPASLKQSKNDEIKTNDVEKETKPTKKVENTNTTTTTTTGAQQSQQNSNNSTANMTKQQLTGPYLGHTGFVNLGNTCYINATLQCLANTTDFRDFFMDIGFKNEINTTNPLGLKGNLAIAYAMLQRQVWSGQQPQLAPSKVRELVSQKYPNFNGYAQQDAQEFMGSLLSLLHEDLNRIQKRPVLEPLESDGWQDTRISEESWNRFLSRDDSIVVDNFFGQFKSKLTCPVCNKVSITFEAFNNVLVQLPGPKRRLNAIVMLKNGENMPVKFITDLPKSGHFKDLIDQVVEYFDVKTTNSEFYIYKVENSKISQFYKLDDSLEEFRYIDNSSVLVVNEVIKKKSVKEPIVELQIEHEIKCILPHPDKCNYCNESEETCTLKRCTKCLSVAYCNTECQRSDWVSHKPECVAKGNTTHAIPFVLTLEKSTINENYLKQLFVNHSKYFVEINPSANDNYEIEVSKKQTFKTLTEFTNYLQQTNNSMQTHKIKIIWNNKLLNRNIKEFDINQLKHVFSPNIHAANAQNQQHNTLDDCLKLFTHPEVLTPDNPWYCPKCKKHQEATKQIYLWKLPKYLIIILKRFQAHKAEDISTAHYPEWLRAKYGYYLQNRVTYSKINSLIKLPLHGLNMAPYIYDPTAATNTANNSNYDCLNENVYDLYGVINHHGESLYSGHYTAFTRCHDPNDTLKNQFGWRFFDDTRVVGVSENEVITKDAYVLFYRRRKSTLATNMPSQHKKQLDVDIDKKLFESNNYIKNLNINQNNANNDDDDDDEDEEEMDNHNNFSSLPSTPSSASPSPSSHSSTLSSSSDEYEDAEATVFTNLHELD